MILLILSLCFVKALPEAFNLMKYAVSILLTDSARVSAEVSAGHWSPSA
jgi:hypothetical protein